jgi:ElaB/YqjD/DUF883 family membrane-anchored ribosome-binding protein
MANTKNETGKTSGTQAGTTGNVSAGTSVGNIGEPPMPHAHEQRSAQGSGTSSGNQASGQQRNQSSQQGAQDQSGSMADKAQQTAEQVRQKAEDTYEGASEWARDTYERASHWASDTYEDQRRRANKMRGRSARAFGHARGGVQNYVSENPMVVGLVGLAARFATRDFAMPVMPPIAVANMSKMPSAAKRRASAGTRASSTASGMPTAIKLELRRR